VAIATEALNDILTNLVVNALDAAARGGHVQVEISQKDGNGLLQWKMTPQDCRGAAEKILSHFSRQKRRGRGWMASWARRASDAAASLNREPREKWAGHEISRDAASGRKVSNDVTQKRNTEARK